MVVVLACFVVISLFVLLLFFVINFFFPFLFFLRESNMISLSALEFEHYVVIVVYGRDFARISKRFNTSIKIGIYGRDFARIYTEKNFIDHCQ